MRIQARFLLSPCVAAAALLVVCGCSTVRSASDYDTTARFYSYTTFAVAEPQAETTESSAELLLTAKAIEASLQHKGFEAVSDPAKADFVVDFSLDSPAHPPGALSIDIIDQKVHRPVWHGYSKQALAQREAPQIQQSVADVLSWFPPGHAQ
jgi:hypothetical protein